MQRIKMRKNSTKYDFRGLSRKRLVASDGQVLFFFGNKKIGCTINSSRATTTTTTWNKRETLGSLLIKMNDCCDETTFIKHLENTKVDQSVPFQYRKINVMHQ